MYGHKRDCEIKTISEFTQYMKLLSSLLPENQEVAAFARKCFLIALMELTRDKDMPTSEQIYEDRLKDCKECEMMGGKECLDKNNYWVGCKWSRKEHKREYIKAYFGEEAFKYIGMLKDYKDTEVKK